MLVPSEVFHRYNYLAIDPGLSTCGLSNYVIQGNEIESIDACTIVNASIPFESHYPEEYHPDRTIRMHKLCMAYRENLIRLCPILIVCEAPFFNPRMPSAYASLVETISMLRGVTYDFNPCIPFVVFSPQEVKQSFKRSGQTGKLVMKEGLMAIPELMSKLVPPIETLDEHAIDSVAVGYTWWRFQGSG